MSSVVSASTRVATIQALCVVTSYGCTPARVCGDYYITTSHSHHIDLSTLQSVFVWGNTEFDTLFPSSYYTLDNTINFCSKTV